MELPTKKTPAVEANPTKLVIYSLPKAGKTSAVCELENCLILDLERGTIFFDSMSIAINSYEDLIDAIKSIKSSSHKYTYIAIDTITKLQDYAMPYALKLYKSTAMGKNFNGSNVLELPQGAGYLYLREAMTNLLDVIYKLSPYTILLGHIKDSSIEKNGKELVANELDLTGKLKTIVAADVDAIGYLFRRGKQTFINFKPSDTVRCGARPRHLKNQEILIAEELEDGSFVSYWDKIYVPNK